MNSLDLGMQQFLAHFAKRSDAFDYVMAAVVNSDVLRNGPLIAALWWAWFDSDSDRMPARRSMVVASMTGAMLATLASRACTHLLSYRPRPVMTPGVRDLLPYVSTANAHWAEHHSSFPSDTATLAFALSVGLFLMSRRAGIAALLWSVVVVSFPKVYLGAHWITDIFGAALLGGTLVVIVARWQSRNALDRIFMRFAERAPQAFYPLVFLASCEIMAQFETLRGVSWWLIGKRLH